MHNQPLEKRRAEDITEAIRRAKEYAQQQDVPLTAERLAAELDMDLGLYHAIVDGEYPAGSRLLAEKVALIQRAGGEATASVVEHAMRRGTGTNMHLLYLKNNAGYDQKDQDRTAGKNADKPLPPVMFVGEEDMID